MKYYRLANRKVNDEAIFDLNILLALGNLESKVDDIFYLLNFFNHNFEL